MLAAATGATGEQHLWNKAEPSRVEASMSSEGERKKLETLAPLAAGAVGVVSPTGGLVTAIGGELFKRVLSRSADKKLWRWLSDVAAAQEFGSPEGVAEMIDEHVDEPWAYEGVVQGIRLVLEAVDPAVMPSLAALSADYFAEQKPPDRFYKRCARLLSDCDGNDLAVLGEVLDSLAANADEGRVEISGGEMAEGWEDVVFEFVGDPCASDLGRVSWRLEGSDTMQNVLRLLRANNFAESAVTRDQTPMPYAETSADLRATTRIADDQLQELFGMSRYVVVPVDRGNHDE
jgi:hypothetical protein